MSGGANADAPQPIGVSKVGTEQRETRGRRVGVSEFYSSSSLRSMSDEPLPMHCGVKPRNASSRSGAFRTQEMQHFIETESIQREEEFRISSAREHFSLQTL
jgi:hypothetical protein